MQLFRLFATGRAKWSEFRLTLRGVSRKRVRAARCFPSNFLVPSGTEKLFIR